ncbi:hypothetical protein MIMGU_mgv1a016739mg [Erythranthe guttata]|uniref:Uncharacterized protein n=1 Tax=Erythranthe guttata TaxID=4155 RepID=A0A022Q9B7_ERYGU|nr:hypothetical protein MIMGU_mgv1a016739mg [Erythranthe guttata]
MIIIVTVTLFILFSEQNQLRLRPADLSRRHHRGGRRRRRRSGGRGSIHQRERALAPRPPDRVRNVGVPRRGVRAVAAGLVHGALAVLVIRASLDAHIAARDAAFEHSPE